MQWQRYIMCVCVCLIVYIHYIYSMYARIVYVCSSHPSMCACVALHKLYICTYAACWTCSLCCVFVELFAQSFCLLVHVPSQALYSRLFSWIVNRINQILEPGPAVKYVNHVVTWCRDTRPVSLPLVCQLAQTDSIHIDLYLMCSMRMLWSAFGTLMWSQ